MGDGVTSSRSRNSSRGLPELLFAVYDEGLMKRYGPGEYIFREGEASFDFFVIRAGVVEIQKNKEPGRPPVVVAYLATGECFGRDGSHLRPLPVGFDWCPRKPRSCGFPLKNTRK